VLRLGNVYLDTLELRARAVPWSEELARRTGHAVRVGVPLADEVVIIHHEARPDGSGQMPEVGIVIPAHASALGKVMLAYLPDEADTVLRRQSLRSMTGETLTDPSELRAQLDRLRSGGVALECDEAVLGESSVAAAVFDATGLAVGAVAIVVPTTEWPVDDTAVEAVRATARTLSRELAAQQWPVDSR
jgi:DNA-binding IclR family transcriptional regulator